MRWKRAPEKFLPECVYRMPSGETSVLVGKMWQGDGSVHLSQHHSYGNLYYATSSKALASGLQHLLLRLGVVSGVCEKIFPYKEGRVGYTVHVSSYENVVRFAETAGRHLIGQVAYRLRQLLEEHPQRSSTKVPRSGSTDVIPVALALPELRRVRDDGLFPPHLSRRSCHPPKGKKGYRRETIREVAEWSGSGILSRLTDADIFWDQVAEVTPVGERETYDLTVPVHHNFIVNDIITHNSHSVSYAMLSYQTAWFKRHHPAIFYAALINQELRVRNQDRMVEYVYDAPRNGVEVLQPDIRTAGPMCQVVEGGAQIRMGLEGVKGISANGSTYLAKLMADPDNHELDAFLLAAAPKALKNSLVVDMVEIGLMDSMIDVDPSMGISEKLHLRGRIIAALEHVNLWRKKCADHPLCPSGQGFYSDVEALLKEKVTYYELRDLEKEGNRRGYDKWREALHAFHTFHLNLDHVLSRENEVLGLFVSGDPLASYEDLISGAGLVEFSSLEPRDHGNTCEFVGVISSVTHRTAKASKRQYSEIRVGDGTHSIETLVFYNEHIRESSIEIGNVIRFEARVEWKEGHTFVLRIRSVSVLGNLGAVARQSYRVGINCRRLPMQKILDAREEVLLSPHGDSPVYLECGATVGLLRSVAMTGELQAYLESLKHVTIAEQMQDFPEEMAS
ncbi:MAG: hypothetical protein HN396_18615 [Gemmatimonadales bacterium]|nr:hypothetical protein [Gemmatimonadales bacterium]